jgi:hypothetical protein
MSTAKTSYLIFTASHDYPAKSDEILWRRKTRTMTTEDALLLRRADESPLINLDDAEMRMYNVNNNGFSNTVIGTLT